MDFNYNLMYKEYFRIYESSKRKYAFAQITQKEFKNIIILATKNALETETEDERNFKIALKKELDIYLRQLSVKKLKEDQFYYLDNYFSNLKIIGTNYDKFLKTLEEIVDFLNKFDVIITSITADRLVQNNININYIMKNYYTYSNNLRKNKIFKDRNINTLLLSYALKENNEINQKGKEEETSKEDYFKIKLNRSLYNIYDAYSKEEVNIAYNCLNPENKEILSKVFNAYLEPLEKIKITNSENLRIRYVIFIELENMLKRNKGEMPHRNNFYYRYKGYTKEEVMSIADSLDFNNKAIIGVRYDINGNYKDGLLSKNINRKLRSILNSKMYYYLKTLHLRRITIFLYDYYRCAYSIPLLKDTLDNLGFEYQEEMYACLQFDNEMPIIVDEENLNKLIKTFDTEIRLKNDKNLKRKFAK